MYFHPLREVGTRQKILILAGVAAVLIGMNSFYICLLLGNGICLLMRAVEKSMKERERKENLLKDGEEKYGIFWVLPSGFSASGSFENLSGSEPHWERMDFQADSEPWNSMVMLLHS